jgi:hypothetical protein
VKNNQLDFTKSLSNNPSVRTLISDKLIPPASYILKKDVLRTLSYIGLDEDSSKIIKEKSSHLCRDGEI